MNWESIIRYEKFFLKSTVFPAKALQERRQNEISSFPLKS
ncbi:hypothetical protein HMPREF0239_01996 [Clostridium sp. ATCC BAA-442]|nr:hypothetical protein HMPREF0239_01996 [Clostridium sp. ATCC BAA-442]